MNELSLNINQSCKIVSGNNSYAEIALKLSGSVRTEQSKPQGAVRKRPKFTGSVGAIQELP